MAMRAELSPDSQTGDRGASSLLNPDLRLNGEFKGRQVGSIRVREMNLQSGAEMQAYINFLNDDRNVGHFATPPRDVEELRAEASRPENHFLVATILEDDKTMLFPEGKRVERVIGGAVVSDNLKPNENDHWIGLVVVDPDIQGQGLGKRVLLGTIDWAFGRGHQTFDRRPRFKLDISVILDADELRRVGGREALKNEDEQGVREAIKKLQEERHESVRMIQLADFFDFRPMSISFEEISVPGKTEAQPTARFELTLRYWMNKQKKDRAFRDKINALRSAA